jgi:hypothetical protein
MKEMSDIKIVIGFLSRSKKKEESTENLLFLFDISSLIEIFSYD